MPMKMSRVSLLVLIGCFLLLNPPLSAATNPGLVMRVYQKGLDDGAKIGVTMLAANISSAAVSDQCDTVVIPLVGTASYCSSGNQLYGFKYASTGLAVNPGVGMTWSISGASVMLGSKWNYSLATSLGTATDHGGYTISVTDVSMSIQFAIGFSSASGKMTISASSCTCSIGSLDVLIPGAPDWFITLMNAFANGPLKGVLEATMQNAACLVINVGGTAMLATQTTHEQVTNSLTFDFGIVSAPNFGAGYVDFDLAGTFSSAGRSVVPGSLPQAMVLPTSVAGTSAVCISSYEFDAIGYFLFSKGLLNFSLSKSSLGGLKIPSKYSWIAAYLQTTCCKTCKCIGKDVRALGRKKPKSTVTVLMKITSAPKAALTSTTSLITFAAQITIQCRSSGGAVSTALLLNVAGHVSIVSTVANNKMVAKFSQLVLKTTVAKSSIGSVTVSSLSNTLAAFSDVILLPALNSAGAIGVGLMHMAGYNYVYLSTQLITDGMCLITTPQYGQIAP